jgi:hypothetical protein
VARVTRRPQVGSPEAALHLVIVIKLRGVNFALGRTTAFSTHATNTTDASYLCRPGNPSRIRPHRASDCGHAYVRATSARLFGSPCWQSDRRNLATRKETALGARPEAAPYGLRSPQGYRDSILIWTGEIGRRLQTGERYRYADVFAVMKMIWQQGLQAAA